MMAHCCSFSHDIVAECLTDCLTGLISTFEIVGVHVNSLMCFRVWCAGQELMYIINAMRTAT